MLSSVTVPVGHCSRFRSFLWQKPSCYQDSKSLARCVVGSEIRAQEAAPAPAKRECLSRRAAVLSVGIAGLGVFVSPPDERRRVATAVAVEEGKQTNLSIEQVKAIIENDISYGQYYITGNLTPSIYNDNCKFTDPTTVVTGVAKYVAAVRLLFDPKNSQQELLSIDITGPKTIEVNWRLGGYLKLPWKPRIKPYEGSTRYTLGDDGLIASHEETWNLSVATAFLELFTPSWGET